MITKETEAAPSQSECKSEVRIHIDQKLHVSPNPTTGEALYLLGEVAEGLVLYHDDVGCREDVEVENNRETIHLRSGEKFRSGKPEKKEVDIVVNGRQRTVSKNKLTFLEVVALAFDPIPSGPNLIFTVTYWNGPRANPEGTMLEDSKVKLQDGMVFNVTSTDKS